MNRFEHTTRFGLAALAAMALMMGSLSAGAVPITWNLVNVTFDDGGIATGSFTFDADINTVSAWSITTSGGNLTNFPSPYTYSDTLAGQTVSISTVALDGQSFIFDSGVPIVSSRDIRLDPISLLTNAGGSIALDLANPSRNVECFNCSPFRLITGGSVVAAQVPEPSTLGLMAIGLAGIGFARKRTKA